MNVDMSREGSEESDVNRKRKVDLQEDAATKLRRSDSDDATTRDGSNLLLQRRYRDMLSAKTIQERNDGNEKQRSNVLPGSAVSTSGLSLVQQGSMFHPSLDTIGGLQLGRQLAILGNVGDFADVNAAIARRSALVAQQQLLAVAATAQLRHQQALLRHHPTTAALMSRGHDPLMGGVGAAAQANILANLHGFNATNSTLMFPHEMAARGVSSVNPSIETSRQLSADQHTNLRGAHWNPVSSPPPPGAEKKQHPTVDLYMRCDDELLSEHQILLRKQIEYFEAGPQEVQSITHGRRREIVLGQVGIRCKHCAQLPPRSRPKGAVYYPASLRALYQAAQNMAASHFTLSCERIGDDLKSQFQAFQGAKASAGHGGKKYWSDCAKAVGIVETETCLTFKD